MDLKKTKKVRDLNTLVQEQILKKTQTSARFQVSVRCEAFSAPLFVPSMEVEVKSHYLHGL